MRDSLPKFGEHSKSGEDSIIEASGAQDFRSQELNIKESTNQHSKEHSLTNLGSQVEIYKLEQPARKYAALLEKSKEANQSAA